MLAIAPVLGSSQVQQVPNALPLYEEGAIYFKIADASSIQVSMGPNGVTGNSASLNAVLNQYGTTDVTLPFELLNKAKFDRIYKAYFNQPDNTSQLIAALEQLSVVEYAERASGQKMLNGDQINPYDKNDFGYDLPQGAVALPWPGQAERYVLLHETLDFLPFGEGFASVDLRYSVISMEENDGFGAVTEKRVLIIEDTLNMGQLTAVQHANGRDWWLLTPRKNTNEYYRILLSPEGITNEGVQAVGLSVRSGLGQACFSPDGQWYVRYNTINNSVGDFVDIYRFDRCTGM